MKSIIILLLAVTAAGVSCAVRSSEKNPRFKREISYVSAPNQVHAKRRLDLRLPEHPVSAPVMVMIHGGAWSIGDKDYGNCNINSDKAALFTGMGYIFATINYRLSPEVKHPEHVRDVAMAIAWLHNNIASYGGDPNRIYLIGHSAGAHLAALTAIDPRYLKEFKISPAILKGVILLDGAGYDIPRQTTKMLKAGILYRWYIAAFTTDKATQADASPVIHVVDNASIPPFLMFYLSQREDACEQNELLAAKLTAGGFRAQLVPVKGKTHRSINSDIGTRNDAVSAVIVNFLTSGVANSTPQP